MPQKSYEELGPLAQQVIDAAIYYTEAYRIIEGKDWKDERDEFASDQKSLVDYLRKLYALDSQTNPPRYFDWHSEGRSLIHAALEIQEKYTSPKDADPDAAMLHDFLIGPELEQLVGHLDNLPYPQPGKDDGAELRGR